MLLVSFSKWMYKGRRDVTVAYALLSTCQVCFPLHDSVAFFTVPILVRKLGSVLENL